MGRPAVTLADALANIQDPHNWAEPEVLYEVLGSVPSVRGIVYGNVAEVEFARWLVGAGIPLESQSRDDDHAKTKSDRTIIHAGNRYTIQVKSPQTNSIQELDRARFQFDVQVDASDRRKVTLPNGHEVNTTCYVAGEFDVLAVPLHAFLGEWDFAFCLNADLPRSPSNRYAPEDRVYLLKTLVRLECPLPESGDWTEDLLGLLAAAPDLGEVIEVTDERIVVRPPEEDEVAVIEESDSEEP